MKKMGNQIGRPRPPAVDEIKIFDNDDKATKHSENIFFILAFLVLGLYFFYTRGVLVEISLLF